MFPSIGDLLNHLLGTQLILPVQTLGFFMALAFIFPYFVFKAEFKRKEADGLVQPFQQNVITGAPASAAELLVNGLLGFLFGFKIIGALINYRLFLFDPQGFIFSWRGNLLTGLLFGAAFAYWAYIDRKKARLPEPVVSEKTVHPYQLTMRLVFTVAFWGFIGAKLFDSAEHLDDLRYAPLGTLFSTNGFTYYGGLIFGALAYLYTGHKRGMKLVHLADIGSPGMMLAYAIGRIGCQLSGDGDWGIINNHTKPHWLTWLPDWAWSFRFPHNEINAGLPIPGCIGNFCNELVKSVYPTSLYEAVICMLLFIFMWLIRKRIRIAGLMFYLYLVLNGTERLLIETIRVNVKYKFLDIVFTQAELICAAMIIGGFTGFAFIIYRHRHVDLNKI